MIKPELSERGINKKELGTDPSPELFWHQNIRMRKTIIFILMTVICFSCSIEKQVASVKPESDIALVKDRDRAVMELVQLWGIDQGVRNPELFHDSIYPGYVKITKIDSMCFDRAITFIKKYGWPTEQTVGDFYEYEETHALSPILLHSPHRLKNDSIYQLLKGEVIAKRLKPESLALFLDKYYVTYEKRSLYNSPFKVWTPAKGVLLKDKHLSDSLMKDIGLSPLPDSIYKK